MEKFKNLQTDKPIKLNLQFFADGEGESGDGAPAEPPTQSGEGGEGGEGGQESKTFTQDDLNKIISDRLSKERKKWDEELSSKVEEAKTEAQKLAKMNAEQKAEYERKQLEEQLSKREAEITRRELRATALETLAEKGLPKQLAEVLVYTDAEATNKSIDAVEKSFRDAVEQAVNDRLKNTTPPKTGGGGTPSSLEEQIGAIFAK